MTLKPKPVCHCYDGHHTQQHVATGKIASYCGSTFSFYTFFNTVPTSFIGYNNTAHPVHQYKVVNVTVFGQTFYKNSTTR